MSVSMKTRLNNITRRLFSHFIIHLCSCSPLSWADSQICQPAIGIPPGATLNTNGAGDAFTAGFVVATMMRSIGENSYLSLKQASEFASLVAARHVDTNTRNLESLNVNDLLSNIL